MGKTLQQDAGPRLSNLDHIFNPSSVAFVGATETVNKWGFIVFNNLLIGGYKGRLYPVNPGRETIMGIKTYPRVRDIPDEVDMAVFTVPASQVLPAIDDCAAKGVKAGLVISAGFKELGGESAEMERELVRRARNAGMVLVGPNGQGIASPGRDFFPWMPMLYPQPGRVGVVSQSGNILSMLVQSLHGYGFGVSKAISSGNEADVRLQDYLEYLSRDPETDTILAYIESVPDGRAFFERAREVSPRKPIILIKGGRSESGMAAAQSHTGAMAVSGELFDAACKQAGLLTARTIDEAAGLAAAFLERPLPRGRRVGIVTGGGGLGVIASDVCTVEGLDVVRLSDGVLSDLADCLPDWWVPGNPVDMVAGLDFEAMPKVMRILMDSGEVDSIIFIWQTPARAPGLLPRHLERGLNMIPAWDAVQKASVERWQELYGLMREKGIPLYIVSNLMELQDPDTRQAYAGTPAVFTTVEMGCRAIAETAAYRARAERLSNMV
ncbi:MAG: acetate--CoA ligase family protein [Candidatus Geothermincolia bacterium]